MRCEDLIPQAYLQNNFGCRLARRPKLFVQSKVGRLLVRAIPSSFFIARAAASWPGILTITAGIVTHYYGRKLWSAPQRYGDAGNGQEEEQQLPLHLHIPSPASMPKVPAPVSSNAKKPCPCVCQCHKTLPPRLPMPYNPAAVSASALKPCPRCANAMKPCPCVCKAFQGGQHEISRTSGCARVNVKTLISSNQTTGEGMLYADFGIPFVK